MNITNVSPEMLAMLDGEMKDIQSKKRGFRNVKIEENDSWLLRYIPFEFGTAASKPFYLKVANHWISKRPHFCPRNSSMEVGGSPDAPCELCDASEDMANSSDQAFRKAGFRASATQQWLMYCWVLERELAKNRGDIEVVGGDERWIPWEYWHSKCGFEEFIGIFRQCANRKHNAINVMDFINGCNFWAASTAKGISLRREDAGPLFDENATGYSDEELQGIIDFTWSKIKVPSYTLLTAEQMDAALVKLEESARADTAKPAARRNFRESSEDDGGLSPQTRSAPPRASAPAAPRAAAPPAPRAAASAPPAAAPRVAAPTSAVPRRSAPPSARSQVPAEAPEQASEAPRSSLSDRLRVRQPAAPAVSREEAPGPSRGAPGANTLEESDNVTDEQRDPAPPAEVPIDDPPEVSAEGEPAPDPVDPPPAPTSSAPRINSRLASGIASAAKRK